MRELCRLASRPEPRRTETSTDVVDRKAMDKAYAAARAMVEQLKSTAGAGKGAQPAVRTKFRGRREGHQD